jgi:hypothetical protein
MILPDFVLNSRVNTQMDYSGIDKFEHCLDKKHFDNYPYQVEYVYNSRGFRDQEWPTDLDKLRSSIWCIGDSFTAGVGSPLEHTWPYLLQQQAGQRTINVSMDGASNDWIARKAIRVINTISPGTVVIHWSYLHRREEEQSDTNKDDESRVKQYAVRETNQSDLDNLIKNINDVERCADKKYKLIHSFIPMCAPFNIIIPVSNFTAVSIPQLTNIDYARDYHHYDIKTANFFVKQIIDIISAAR